MALTKSDVRTLANCLKDYGLTRGAAVTFGTQTVNVSYPELVRLLLLEGVDIAPITTEDRQDLFDFYEKYSPHRLSGNILLRLLGFQDIVNIDVIAHTPRAVVHNLSLPVPDSMHGGYDLMLDASTGHHVFDRVQLFKNVKDVLRVGGVAMHMTLLDPFCQAEGFLNLHSLLRFYESNGFGDIRAFFCGVYSRNSIYELKGDLHGYRNVFDNGHYGLVFCARKLQEVPLDTSFLSWHYELASRVPSECGVQPQAITGKKVAIWGTKGHYQQWYRDLVTNAGTNHTVVAIVDGDSTAWGQKLDGFEILPPTRLNDLDVDAVLLASYQKVELFSALTEILLGKPEVVRNTMGLYPNTFLAHENGRVFEEYWQTVHGRPSSPQD